MIQGIDLASAIASAWEDICLILGEGSAAFEGKLLLLLRKLEASPNDENTINQILKLFGEYPKAQERLYQSVSEIAPRKGIQTGATFIPRERYTVVPVLYGTDRAELSDREPNTWYGSGRGEPVYGVAEVSIPDDHKMGVIEKPSLWKLQFREDPEQHVIVLRIEPLAADSFVDHGQRMMSAAGKKEVLVFVHGYNVGFAEALRRTAQIAYDLHFDGLPVLYSWPSEGALPSYTVDETNVMWARPHFRTFMDLVREEFGADCVHVIAHSMGSRLVTETLAAAGPQTGPGQASLRQFILAAPDIDAETFKDLATAFQGSVERCTLYASSKDKALVMSRMIHRYPRAGESGPGLVVMKSVDTIDASTLDTGLSGHSYYGDNRSVLTDLFDLIRRGTSPGDRFGLVPKERSGMRYWLFSL
jgi:esterase/lipase superfamily enzyme